MACMCPAIMAADPSRHFRGCPERREQDGLPTSRAEVVALQTAAMRSIVENMRASLEAYVEAVSQSAELQERLKTTPASELGGVFDLVVRRALALVASAEKQTDGPITETKEPS